MWNRRGLGPVFRYEMLLHARRWQVFAWRALFVLLLLIGMVIVWVALERFTPLPARRLTDRQQLARLGEWFFYAMAGIQVSLVMLAAPAGSVGSICTERARGTLLHLLVTDLSDTEIVVGTLGAGLMPVVGMIACGVPVAALSALLGGVGFGAIAGLFVVSLSLAVLVCALALALSVWAPKTHEVLIAVYLIVSSWLLALPVWFDLARGGMIVGPPAWFLKGNPYVLVLAPYNNPGFAGPADFAAFVAISLALSGALAILSIARLRRAVIAQSGRAHQGIRRRLPELKRFFPSWPSPTLDGNPVLWREWHRSRPSKLARRLWTLLLVVVWTMMAWGTYEAVTVGLASDSRGFSTGDLVLYLFGFLMLCATAPTALAEERARGSLDVLLVTPLATRSIVGAKWWGMYRTVLVLALLPLYEAVFVAASVPDLPIWPGAVRFAHQLVPLTDRDRIIAAALGPLDFLVSGALLVSVGLALATWVRRLGRAVALSTVVYFLTGIVWLLVLEFGSALIRFGRWTDSIRAGWLYSCLMSLSPIFGPMRPTETLTEIQLNPRTPLWIGMFVALVIKAAVAGLLLWLTVKTFDRSLGRISESRIPMRRHVPVVEEELAASTVS
jgi:ABC-type transport system involved in multi-copper enzyme maturation permease subunit